MCAAIRSKRVNNLHKEHQILFSLVRGEINHIITLSLQHIDAEKKEKKRENLVSQISS